MTELALVDSTEEVEAFLRWLGQRRPILAFDIETTGLDPHRDRVRLAQFGDAETGWAIPYGDWRGLVRHVMDRYEGPMVAHNMKFDASFLAVDGIRVPRHRFHDTMTMTHLADSHGPKGLKQAATRYVGAGSAAGERELKEGMRAAGWNWATVPEDFEPFWSYAAIDTIITARLAERLWGRIQPHREAYEREAAVTWVLMDMELRGAVVDEEYCRRVGDELRAELELIQGDWPGLNLFSSAQLADFLSADGVRLTRRTEKGNPRMDEAVLRSIDHPLAHAALAARERKKLFGTYLDPFVRLAVGGVLHPNINPLGAEKTGRMSISRPSMQNLPRRKVVRDAIIAREGNVLVLADYQGQEMRVLAHYSRDTRMMEAYHAGEDLHTYAARLIYGVDDPTKEQRRIAKQSGFAKVYGAGPKKFAETAGIPMREGKLFLAKYDRTFPRVPRFQQQVQQTVKRREEPDGFGWVGTFGGRKVRVPARGAYKGVNYLIQGSCADITKQAMIDCDRAGVGQYMTLPVHDEIVFDCPAGEAEEVIREAQRAMERDDLAVPLIVETQVVDRWGDPYED